MSKASTNPANAFDLDQDHTGDMADDGTPSWFSRTYGETDVASRYRESQAAHRVSPQPVVAENAAAYEAYRQRVEQRFAAAQRAADPDYFPQDNGAEPAGADFPRRPDYAKRGTPPKARKAVRQQQRIVGPATIAILTLTACGIGGGAGYLAANPDVASHGLAYASAIWFKPADDGGQTVIAKKPVHIARLAVKDTAGAINSPIPLDLAAVPADASTPVALRISGLPPAAYLTKGVEIAKGQWVLKPSDFANTELVVPHTDVPEITLEVAALDEKTGTQSAPAQSLNVAIDTSVLPVPGVPQPKVNVAQIIPANASPDQGFNKQELPLAVPAPLETSNPEAQALITKGNGLLGTGDILAARQFYLRAFDMNAPQAAYGVGQTFDPAVYSRLHIKGLKADAQQAAEWYGKAAAAGHAEAGAALAALPLAP